MRSRHFENKARQSFWLVHIEAWRRSGLSQTVYCRKHRLARNVFARWLKYLAGEEAARKHVESASIASVKNVVSNAKKEARSRKDDVMG